MTTMTHEAQRIAIAEACGWKPGGSGKTWGDGQTFGIPPNGEDWHWQEMPDYYNDLNAMHAAEKALTRQQQTEYAYQLSEIVAPITAEDWCIAHATAAQRAEAFLRTLNLWRP